MADPINIVATPRATANPIPFKITNEVPGEEPVVEEFLFTPPGSEGMLIPYLDGTDDYLRAGWQWLLAGLDATDQAKAEAARVAAQDDTAKAAAADLEGVQSARLREKYADPKDPFGTDGLGQLIRALDGAAAERPTTSPDA